MRTFDEQRKYDAEQKLREVIKQRGTDMSSIVQFEDGSACNSFANEFAYYANNNIRVGEAGIDGYENDKVKIGDHFGMSTLKQVMDVAEEYKKNDIAAWPNLLMVSLSQDRDVSIANPYAKIMQQKFIYDGFVKKMKEEKGGEITKDNIVDFCKCNDSICRNLDVIANARATMIVRDIMLTFTSRIDAAFRKNESIVDLINKYRSDYDNDNLLNQFSTAQQWDFNDVKQSAIDALVNVTKNLAFSVIDNGIDEVVSMKVIMKINEIVMQLYDSTDIIIVNMIMNMCRGRDTYVDPNTVHALLIQEAYGPIEDFRDDMMTAFLTMRYESMYFYHTVPVFNSKEAIEQREALILEAHNDDINIITNALSGLQDGETTNVEMCDGQPVTVVKF